MERPDQDAEDGDPVEQLRRELVARALREESRRQEQEDRRRRRLQIARASALHTARVAGLAVLHAVRLAARALRAASRLPRRLGVALERVALRGRSRASAPPSLKAEEPVPPVGTDAVTRRELEIERLDRRQLWLREESLGPDHPDLVPVARLVAQHDWAGGNRLEALLLYERAFSISERILGPDHIELASIADELGDMYVEVGEPEQARLWHSRAVAIRERSPAPLDPGNAVRTGERTHESPSALPTIPR
jgi:Tetratricopeptide repeat